MTSRNTRANPLPAPEIPVTVPEVPTTAPEASFSASVPPTPAEPRPIVPKETNVPIERFSHGTLELERFLTALRLKFRLDARYFPDDRRKVDYACLNLTGTAMDWYVPLSNSPVFAVRAATYEGFVTLLREQFGDPNPARTAAASIQHVRMDKSYAAYVTEFARWEKHLDWADSTYIHMFRAGLTEALQERLIVKEQIYFHLNAGLTPTFLEVQRMAGECDAEKRARDIELKHQRSVAKPRVPERSSDHSDRGGKSADDARSRPRSSSGRQGAGSAGNSSSRRSKQRGLTKGSNSSKTSNNDDAEASSAGKPSSEVTCYNCKKVGHISPDCPEKKEKPDSSKKGKGGPKK